VTDLDAARLTAALSGIAGPWTAIEVVRQTGSTNTDLLARAASGAPEGLVLAAEEQNAGRGRLGRSWVTPPGTALAFSVLLRPSAIPATRHGWLPLIAGISVAAATNAFSQIGARLKWPNDVLIGRGKLAGILAEGAGDAVVIGIGMNVLTPPGELPAGPGGLLPTSLLAAGALVTREAMLIEILHALGERYERFCANPDPWNSGLTGEYLGLSATLGHNVRVELPGGAILVGQAVFIDNDGRLVVNADGQEHAVAAGDVIHLR
jgi:BirA family transcriptional regulator, biotin operon repressor / biotin---[acetyl-CoA-carboxylase] ligase